MVAPWAGGPSLEVEELEEEWEDEDEEFVSPAFSKPADSISGPSWSS